MKFIGTLILILCCYVATTAQVHQQIIRENPDLPFDQLVEKIEALYRGQDKGRGSGYKQFKRWEYYHSSRLDERGRIQNVPRRLLDEFLDYRAAKSETPNLNFDCQWASVGGHTYQLIASGHNGGLGRVNAIVLDPDDPDIIYAGTPAGGLWRTTNGGGAWNPASAATHWEPLTDGIPSVSVSGIAVDPTSPASNRTLYILTGDGDGSDNPSIGVLKSFDDGDTWFQTGLSFDLNASFVFGYKLLMAPDDPNTLYAATTGGLWRTTDAGITWTNILNGSIFDIEFRPDDPETIYAVTANSFFRSTDGGDNWTTNNCGLTNTGVRLAIAVTPADPDFIYVLSGGLQLDMMGNGIPGTFRGVYRSTNGGDCFTQMSTTPNILDGTMVGSDTRQQATYDLAIAVSTTDENEVHVGGINCWRSLDGGANWTLTAFWNENSAGAGNYNHADIHALEYIGNTLYSGSDGGVYFSDNNADDWTNISQGLVITQYYRIAAFSDGSTDYVMGGAQDNGLNQLRDAGSGFGGLEHWEGADGFGCSVDLANGLVYGATQNGTINSFDYPGGAFNDVSPGAATGGAFLTPHTFDAASGALLAGYTDVWSTTDGGGTWNNISNGMIGTASCRHLEVAPSNSNTIYVAKPLNLYRTTDGGANWTDITNTLPTALNSVITYIAIHPTDANQLWVTMGGFVRFTANGYDQGNKVFYSDDGGATWTNISGSLPNLPANCIIYENGSDDGLYVGMDVGVYYRDNSMNDWVLFSNGLPNAIVADMDINYGTGKLYIGTFGRGVWCTDLFSACNQVCLSCPTFEEIHSQPNIYFSEDCIYSHSVVYDETSITYSAETFILLEEDFHVQSANDAVFYGVIQPCAPGTGTLAQFANTREISGFYVGRLPGAAKAAERTLLAGDVSPSEPASSLRVFPNPAAGSFQLEFTAERPGAASIALYDSRGCQVVVLEHYRHFDPGLFRRSYALQDLPDGTYFVVLTLDGTTHYETLIKQQR